VRKATLERRVTVIGNTATPGEQEAPRRVNRTRRSKSNAEDGRGQDFGGKGTNGKNGGAAVLPEGLADKDRHPYSVKHWLNRTDVAPTEPLLGHILNATDRAFLIGPTGLGKTMFAIAAAMAISAGGDFLHWKGTGKPKRVLYIDGEMPRDVIIERLKDEVRRSKCTPETFWFLSKEDFEDMPPINLQANGRVVGTEYFDGLIALYEPELIIFDNLQALLVGEMTKEEAWALIVPWIKSLTRKKIAQLWVHHTGHDESRGYGTKTKEWQFDLVMLLKRNKDTEDEGDVLTFDVEFTKRRKSTPKTYREFEPVTVTLKGDRWRSTVVNTTPASHTAILGALARVPNGMSRKDLEDIVGLAHGTFGDAMKALKTKGWIKKTETGLWVAAPVGEPVGRLDGMPIGHPSVLPAVQRRAKEETDPELMAQIYAKLGKGLQ
jgi:AAA domain